MEARDENSPMFTSLEDTNRITDRSKTIQSAGAEDRACESLRDVTDNIVCSIVVPRECY